MLDEIDFGLQPGSELKVETTTCHEIRQSREPVIIESVAEDEFWCKHATPRDVWLSELYLSAYHPGRWLFLRHFMRYRPAAGSPEDTQIVGTFRLFAELIAKHLDAGRKLAATESALNEERTVAELREQFIAVLGHDLRTPTRAIRYLADLLLKLL